MDKKTKTLEYFVNKYNLDLNQHLPIEIPNTGRDNLPIWYKNLGFKVGAEIGVAAGVYSEVLCKLNPGVKLYLIDTWKTYPGYRAYIKQDALDSFFAEAKKRLTNYDVTFIKSFSADAIKQFKDNSLDFVFIDGNHSYNYVLQDIELWIKKIRPGGIISGHDYLRKPVPTTHDVIGAVRDYTQKNNINPWFLLGRQAKNTGEIRDKCRSWFWIKDNL